ncbi:MAG TPA: hypothetical protein VGB85_20445, partial [Nannocystis sp.]
DPSATDPTSTTDTGDTDTGEAGCEPPLPTFVDGKAPTSTLYVKAGAAPGGDGSVAKPFATLLAGITAAQPGTDIRVTGELPGLTYTSGAGGTPEAPIWISGEPGAKIGPLTLESGHDIVLQDLELSSAPEGHVLHFFFADRILIRRLKIHDCGQGCIKGSQATEVYVEDSELWDAGKFKGHPVLDYVGVNGGHIVRSDFHDGPGVMIMLKGGTSDLLFAWNEVHHQTDPGDVLSLGQSTGPQFFQPIDAAFEGLRIIAYANLLHDLTGPPVAFTGCKDCAAVRNTIWNTTGNQLVRFLPGEAGMNSGVMKSIPEGNRFTGNIVVGGQPGGASLNADEPNTGPNNVLDYNVFLKPGALNWWGVVPQDMVHSTYDQDPMLDAGGIPANVALVDGKGPPDLAGLPFAATFTKDAAGACVQQPPDIGAFDVP